jgi:hypothetical protein
MCRWIQSLWLACSIATAMTSVYRFSAAYNNEQAISTLAENGLLAICLAALQPHILFFNSNSLWQRDLLRQFGQ